MEQKVAVEDITSDHRRYPMVAGILSIVSGATWLVIILSLVMLVVGLAAVFGTPLAGWVAVRFALAMTLLAAPGVVSIIGGVFSLRRRRWRVALAGAICAVPLLLGIVAVVLLANSRREFN